ncbi:MAG: molybdopterin-dependent oxidoreductase [Deltaproteobacteria bacterium]|nr:molybdopterin-dependent oxidoreductase [Deltaproteobacteria bacterium]
MESSGNIGASVPRIDAIEKVTGRTLYGPDLKMQGMLYGKVLRSPLPHARILSVDTSKAERLPGVKAVVTGKNMMGRYGVIVQDQPCYCFDKVRYIGDPVAGVAAVDLDTAEEALELIKVDYEELPPVFDPLEAMEPNAPLVHEDLGNYWHGPAFFPVAGTNICNQFKLRKGNVEEGFRQSDFIAENTFTTPMVQHCHLEPHASIAKFEPSGQVTIWSNTQHPYTVRREVARLLSLPINRVRVIVSYLGGGFGGKVMLKVEPLCLILAVKVKNYRPVKITLTREEEFYATSVVRHPSIIQIKAGVRKDGTLMALKTKIVFDTGAYADVGPVVTRSVGMSISGPYKIPHIWGDAYCVYTNKSIAGAFRGFGIPQFMWAIDSQMDILAEEIGMDPVEFRLKNALEEGDVSATGQILHSVGIKECIRKAAEAIEWGKKTGEYRGKGMGTLYKMTQTPSSSAAFVKLSEDGSVEVLSSTVDMGQGSNTVLAQIAAEELGVDVKNVKVVPPDTNVTPFDHGTASSRSTFHMGNAVKQAAADAKKQLFEVAAEQLEVKPEELEARGGFLYIKGSSGKGIPISQIRMGITYGKGRPIIGRGTFSVPEATPLDQETGQGANPSVFWLYGAQAAEVKVDPSTGKVEVLRIAAAHDLGRVINPLNCEQQIEGAVVTGIGTALMEELVIREGKPANTNFRDYRVPTSLDAPEVTSIFVEAAHKEGPYGAKGVGEPALAPTAPAIGNAVYDAIGVRIKDLPITPEKVLKALREKDEPKK